MQFTGYMLDETHAISVLYDSAHNSIWTLFTFAEPLKDGIIDESTEYTITKIDPENFYLNGKKIQLIAERR